MQSAEVAIARLITLAVFVVIGVRPWTLFHKLQVELSVKRPKKKECRLARAKVNSKSSLFNFLGPVPAILHSLALMT